jgi:ectoine hydroxylase-related dioxygenase (phytanoyl-CoA dioxygenase family)
MQNTVVDAWRFKSGDARYAEFFDRAGFAVIENVLTERSVAVLVDSVSSVVGPDGYALRNLLRSVPAVQQLAISREIRALVESVLGPDAFPVKGILFDKTIGANWKVAWHQDTMITVSERRDLPGFGPWSAKEGVMHVQPPAEVLAGMLTVRVHLDDCGPDNGPLRVLPESHKAGLLSAEAIDARRDSHAAITCTAARGGVLLMRPLTLHASSAATAPRHRRVVHLEYAASPLPNGLHWANR